jgi:polar amino acid transport system substrate-binding protein
MTQFEKLALTRRGALQRGVAALAASAPFLGLTRAAFADDTLAEVKKRGELTTATEMQFPPFDISDNGTYKGLDRDLIDAVGKELGVKVSYLDLPWTSVLPGLEAKKFDLVIAPVTITKERMKRYAFSVPIADATAALMKRANDSSIMKPEDIAGKTVGGQKGTSQVEQLKAFAAKLPKPVEVKEYVDNNQSYADLAAGRIDASVNSFPNLAYVAQQRPDTFAVVTPPFGQPTQEK